MKKNSVFIGIFACLVFGTFAMEERQLSNEEAKIFYLKSAKKFNKGLIAYEEYRSNMKRIIPLLGYVQDTYHDPLKVAVNSNDYDFAQFLLDHGANPRFRAMSGVNSIELMKIRPEKEKQDPEFKNLYNLLNSY